MLQADLDELAARTRQQAQDLQVQQANDRAQLIARHVGQALDQWRKAYAQQSEAMLEMLRQLVRQHWEERVDAMVGERLAEVAELSSAADAAPAQQQAALATLQAEADALQASLKLLTL
jgi:S-methylmethionine-dependent homocysteine/selenocysteine methylase